MNAARQIDHSLREEEKCILRTLLYFDIFNYPLTEDEIRQFSPVSMKTIDREALNKLVTRGLVFGFHGFYSIQNQPALAERRIAGNILARKKLKTAQHFSRFVGCLPFVRAVMLSGSISKGYMDRDSDIDYFIITDVNRLWIVRTTLALIRRIFLFNSHKNLCTNYFVDLHNLEIMEKNTFTAIEFCTLVPMYGKSSFDQLQTSNTWVNQFLPNSPSVEASTNDGKHGFKTMLEKIVSSSNLDKINQWLLQKTIRHWRTRYGALLSDSDFQIAFRSTDGVSKSHPQFFQKKVLHRLDVKIKSFENEKGIDLTL